ncbi:hypothetical protein ACROYT_G027879 [Oculina patagonica]
MKVNSRNNEELRIRDRVVEEMDSFTHLVAQVKEMMEEEHWTPRRGPHWHMQALTGSTRSGASGQREMRTSLTPSRPNAFEESSHQMAGACNKQGSAADGKSRPSKRGGEKEEIMFVWTYLKEQVNNDCAVNGSRRNREKQRQTQNNHW